MLELITMFMTLSELVALTQGVLFSWLIVDILKRIIKLKVDELHPAVIKTMSFLVALVTLIYLHIDLENVKNSTLFFSLFGALVTPRLHKILLHNGAYILEKYLRYKGFNINLRKIISGGKNKDDSN